MTIRGAIPDRTGIACYQYTYRSGCRSFYRRRIQRGKMVLGKRRGVVTHYADEALRRDM